MARAVLTLSTRLEYTGRSAETGNVLGFFVNGGFRVNIPTQEPAPVRDYFDFMARVPSSYYYFGMLASVAISAYLYFTGRRHTALFVGEWAPTILTAGLFYKFLHPTREGIGESFREAVSNITH